MDSFTTLDFNSYQNQLIGDIYFYNSNFTDFYRHHGVDDQHQIENEIKQRSDLNHNGDEVFQNSGDYNIPLGSDHGDHGHHKMKFHKKKDWESKAGSEHPNHCGPGAEENGQFKRHPSRNKHSELKTGMEYQSSNGFEAEERGHFKNSHKKRQDELRGNENHHFANGYLADKQNFKKKPHHRGHKGSENADQEYIPY